VGKKKKKHKQNPRKPKAKPPRNLRVTVQEPRNETVPLLIDTRATQLEAHPAPLLGNQTSAAPPASRWKKGWVWLVKVATVIALLIAFYVLRPVLSAVETDMNPGDTLINLTVTNSGQTPANAIIVHCRVNKVVFMDKFTLELQNYSLWKAYSVNDLKSRESFIAECPTGWTLWMNNKDGFFALGPPNEGPSGALGIGFYFTNGMANLRNRGGTPEFVKSDLKDYTEFSMTSIDASVVIDYSWRFSPLKQEKIIHVVGDSYGGQKIMWRLVPDSEPLIPDGPIAASGFKIVASGGTKPGIVFDFPLKRHVQKN
jgi:hypothetical protein